MLACPECAHRQEAGDTCTSCSYDGLLDLGNMRHRDLLRDIDRRKLDRHNERALKISVARISKLVERMAPEPQFPYLDEYDKQSA